MAQLKMTDSKGQLRQMKPEFWWLWKEMGHSHMDFDKS